MFDREGLLKFIKDMFVLDWNGIHGISHWARVKDNGLKLCEHYPDADPLVVELFAWLHDIARLTDGTDSQHGQRCAKLIVEELLDVYFELSDEQAEDLIIAVRDHSLGTVEGSDTVRVCWDADRLDLGRVGKVPDPIRLCTQQGKNDEMISWANTRAVDGLYGFIPNTNMKY